MTLTEVRFYHLQRTRAGAALPQMLEKVLARGRARGGHGWHRPERVEALDAVSWTYDDRGFLPHGTARDGFADEQPIWLTARTRIPTAPRCCFSPTAPTSDRIADLSLCVELFDGGDEHAVAAARRRWTAYKSAGHALSYFQQTDAGGWEQKASA